MIERQTREDDRGDDLEEGRQDHPGRDACADGGAGRSETRPDGPEPPETAEDRAVAAVENRAGEEHAGVSPGDAQAGRKAAPKPPPARYALFVVVPLLLLIGWGVYSHWRSARDSQAILHRAQSYITPVHVATAQRQSPIHATTLPGQTAAFDSADLYARATGYIAERRVDIGSRVHRGDLLIRIAAPDLDQQLYQAQAQLGQMQAQLVEAKQSLQQAVANSKLSQTNKWRTTTLAKEGWASLQNAQTDQTTARVGETNVTNAQAGIGVAIANIRAQQASVDRLVALTGFERVVAPFDGVVTQRDVDVGDLVTSDTTSGTALLHIDREDVLRCQIYVPQADFPGIHVGLPAKVTIPELPGKVFKATVSRYAHSVMQNSRTMLVEVDIANPDFTLTPGLYVDVSFSIRQPTAMVKVPDSALIFDTHGLHVAVARNGAAHMVPITIFEDLGTDALVKQGLKGGEQVIVNPPTDLAEGTRIAVQPDKKPGDQQGNRQAQDDNSASDSSSG